MIVTSKCSPHPAQSNETTRCIAGSLGLSGIAAANVSGTGAWFVVPHFAHVSSIDRPSVIEADHLAVDASMRRAAPTPRHTAIPTTGREGTL